MIRPPRDLWTRRADTREGNETLDEARRLARMPEYSHLADGGVVSGECSAVSGVVSGECGAVSGGCGECV